MMIMMMSQMTVSQRGISVLNYCLEHNRHRWCF